jgi:hypothetical protein
MAAMKEGFPTAGSGRNESVDCKSTCDPLQPVRFLQSGHLTFELTGGLPLALRLSEGLGGGGDSTDWAAVKSEGQPCRQWW